MKLKSLLVSSLFLTAGLSLANAQTTTFVNTGDLLVGFRSSDSTVNLTVDLGSFTNFNVAAGTLVDLSSRVSGTDINAVSSTWSNLSWAVYGSGSKAQIDPATGLAKNALLFSAQRDSFATLSTAPKNAGSTTQNVSVVNLEHTYDGASQSYANRPSTANSNTFGTLSDGTQAGSYTKEAIGANFFGYANAPLSIIEQQGVGSVGTANSAWALADLYLLTPGTTATTINKPGTYVGTFGLAVANTVDSTGKAYTAGNFLFEAGSASAFVAIPEPSTYAAILGALTVGFVALRRRFSKAV